MSPERARRSARTSSIGLIQVGTPLTREREDVLHQAITDGRRAKTELSLETGATREEHEERRRLVRGGRKAEEELLSSTCALVKKRVNDLGFSFDHDELEAAGLEALVRALREFDTSQSVRFATYANYWISKMVFASISHRVPYPETDLRLVIKYRRIQQKSATAVSVPDVARSLHVTRTEAARIMRMSDDISAGMADVSERSGSHLVDVDAEPWPEAEWVIIRLKEILGGEFEDFWMWTGRVMTLEELGRRHGISKQAMAKRVQRWRRLVESSEHADEMLTWLRAQ